MPLYEYSCKKCAHRFEALVANAKAKAPTCPKCGNAKSEKQFSTFAVGGGKTPTPQFGSGGAGCGSCGDPRGPGACGMN